LVVVVVVLLIKLAEFKFDGVVVSRLILIFISFAFSFDCSIKESLSFVVVLLLMVLFLLDRCCRVLGGVLVAAVSLPDEPAPPLSSKSSSYSSSENFFAFFRLRWLFRSANGMSC
jgi:hypothetical protein